MLQKLYTFLHHMVYWLYADNDRSFSVGGFLGGGLTATLIHINYLYWLKVVLSALIGGLVNICIKKTIDFISRKTGKEGKNG